MTKRKKPPDWQEGEHTFTITLPATETESEEVVELGYKWKVQRTRSLTEKEWIDWEIDGAYNALDRVKEEIKLGKPLTVAGFNHMGSAVTHATAAWCRAHLGKSTNHTANYNAFQDNAPEELHRLASKCMSEKYRMYWFETYSPSEVYEAIREYVDEVVRSCSKYTEVPLDL